jgi:hypothetical protein
MFALLLTDRDPSHGVRLRKSVSWRRMWSSISSGCTDKKTPTFTDPSSPTLTGTQHSRPGALSTDMLPLQGTVHRHAAPAGYCPQTCYPVTWSVRPSQPSRRTPPADLAQRGQFHRLGWCRLIGIPVHLHGERSKTPPRTQFQ